MSQQFVLILFQVVVLVLAFSVHESAHAYVAMRLGDPTAYMLGRVTLNPAKHLDPLGSVLGPLISLVYGGWLIGWAKPCPVTTRNFRHLRRDDILVSMAGPASNLAMATVALLLLIVFTRGAGRPVYHSCRDGDGKPRSGGCGRAAALSGGDAALLWRADQPAAACLQPDPDPAAGRKPCSAPLLPYRVEQVYNQIGMYGLIVLLLFGGHWIASFYYPLMGVYDRLLLML